MTNLLSSSLLNLLRTDFFSAMNLAVLILLAALFCSLFNPQSTFADSSGSQLADSELIDPALIDKGLLSKLEDSVLAEHGFADEYEAEVWFKSMSPRMNRFKRLSDSEKMLILQWVHRESHISNLEPALVLALIEVESSFDRYAISRSGAQGLMQVMSFWKLELGRPEDNLIETQTNLRYGTTILSYYLERAKGDTTEALARYNGSYPKTWYAERVYRALEKWR